MYTFFLPSPNYDVSNFFRKLGYLEVFNTSVAPDFYVFTGGADVTPNLYFQEKHPKTSSIPSRDFNDLCHLTAARLAGIPCVGICRGAQLLHVSLGGTLIQHIDGHAGAIHPLLTDDGKELEGVSVNSTHHQAIPLEETDRYDLVYTSAEQTVEVFLDYERLTLGVQYHPEYSNCPKSGVDLFQDLLKNKLGAMV